jgi:hypothetical protein
LGTAGRTALTRLALAAAAAASLLAGCYNGPGIDSPYPPRSPWPNGVVAEGRAPKITGVYMNGTPQFWICCWIGREAVFQAKTPPKARSLRVDVTVPAMAPFKTNEETLRIGVAGMPETTFPKLAIGDHLLIVPLPSPHPAVSTVRIVASYTWRPVEWNITKDGRDLSVMLRQVRAK